MQNTWLSTTNSLYRNITTNRNSIMHKESLIGLKWKKSIVEFRHLFEEGTQVYFCGIFHFREFLNWKWWFAPKFINAAEFHKTK